MQRSGARIAALAGGIAVLWAAHPTRAAGQGLDLRFRQGYDTNVFQVPTSADSRRLEAHYSRLELGYAVEPATRGLSFFAEPQVAVRWYPQTPSANQYGAELTAGVRNVWVNPERGADWILETVTTLELSGAYERALFLKRQTREEFQEGDSISTVSLPVAEMPSRTEVAGEWSVESEIRDGLTVEGGALFEWTDYRDGGGDVTRSFERLGGREWGLFSEWAVDVASAWELAVEVEWQDRTYPKREAKDAEGESVEGEIRRYAQWEVTGSLEWKRDAVRNRVQVEYDRRDDRFAGYYSYDAWEVGDRLRLSPVRSVTLELRYAYGAKVYDVYASTDSLRAAGTPTRNRYHDAGASLYVDVTPEVDVVLGGWFERVRSNDPLFDYRRLELFGELRIGR